MNQVLKTILETAETVAVKAVPGAGAVDAVVHAVVEHKPADFSVLVQGVLTAVEAFRQEDIVDEHKVAAGVALIQQGAMLVQSGLKRG